MSQYARAMSTSYLVVCTFPNVDEAKRAAGAVVRDKLAACVNIIPGARSIYFWKDEVCDDEEVVALIKTTAQRFDALRARIVELHSYECPEVIALPIDAGHAPYLDWIAESVQPLSEP